MSTTTTDRSSDWVPPDFTVHLVATNGTHLSVAAGGSGPTMVLLHGWPQTGRAWRHVMPLLARDHTVVVPDLRGAGASDRPEDGYAKTSQADDMRGVLAALGLPGKAVVVGHDIGAMVAFAWASTYPEDVAALVLLDSLLPGLGLEEAMNVAAGGMWHFGMFMAPAIPEMLFDGHELEFLTADVPRHEQPRHVLRRRSRPVRRCLPRPRPAPRWLRALPHPPRDGRENRALLDAGPLPMPVLAIGAGSHVSGSHGDGDPAAALRPHTVDVRGVLAPTGHFIAEEAPDWLVAELHEVTSRARAS